MDDSLGVAGVEELQHLVGHQERFLRVERARPRRQEAIERDAAQHRHHDEGQFAIQLAGRDQAHRVGVVESRHHPRLGLELRHQVGVRGRLGAHHLDGDDSAAVGFTGLIDVGHTPGPDQSLDSPAPVDDHPNMRRNRGDGTRHEQGFIWAGGRQNQRGTAKLMNPD